LELKPRSHQKVIDLIQRGVDIPNPLTLALGEEVKVERISGKRVRIYPGCRIYGDKTVLSDGAQIGYEAPATIVDCQLGLT
jgi:UDP-N-acetylglucosamine/UDP-N-acetylgalactosamine diphosphorylase